MSSYRRPQKPLLSDCAPSSASGICRAGKHVNSLSMSHALHSRSPVQLHGSCPHMCLAVQATLSFAAHKQARFHFCSHKAS